MTSIAELTEHREQVIRFVRAKMIEQGASVNDAIATSTRLYFVQLGDVEDLYKCINSDLPQPTIDAIVAHDVNGLVHDAPGFLPKARQFRGQA